MCWNSALHSILIHNVWGVPEQILIHGHADDHGLKKSYRPIQHEEEETIKHLEMCVVEIKEWDGHKQIAYE